MAVALNIGRFLMLGWALYSLVLIFFPRMVNHAPDPKAGAIQFAVAYGIGWADPAEIDALNILQATFLAMRRAVLALPVAARELRIDGNRLPECADLNRPRARAIVGGDGSEACIGAASILAKTVRDAYMDHAHSIYPSYRFSEHKGYPTAAHRQALIEHGPCPLHRRSYAPVREILSLQSPP